MTAEPSTAQELFDGVPYEPGAAKNDPILVADNVRRAFGGLVAVDVEHLEVQRGAITALIGPNGAGKTTFFNLLTNFDEPDTGDRLFEGNDLSGVSAYKVANLGMVRTFQLTKSLSKMTVIDNMRLGGTEQAGESFFRALLPFLWRRQEAEITERADALLERFKLSHMRDEFAGTLSGGQRKLLEMARALMVRPNMVMLDEPMAGVDAGSQEQIFAILAGLRDAGKLVVAVHHDLQTAARWFDAVALVDMRLVATGPTDVVLTPENLNQTYAGRAGILDELGRAVARGKRTP